MRKSIDWFLVSGEDEAFYLRVYTAGDYRYHGADMGILVSRGRFQTDDRKLTDRARAWVAAIHRQFEAIPVTGSAAPAPPPMNAAILFAAPPGPKAPTRRSQHGSVQKGQKMQASRNTDQRAIGLAARGVDFGVDQPGPDACDANAFGRDLGEIAGDLTQHLMQHGRAFPLARREIDVARREREPVRLSDGRVRHDVDGQERDVAVVVEPLVEVGGARGERVALAHVAGLETGVVASGAALLDERQDVG